MAAIFLAHPQNRFNENGLRFCVSQYEYVKKELEKVFGSPITDEALKNAIRAYNESRAARRRFVQLTGDHCDVITPAMRAVVLKTS